MRPCIIIDTETTGLPAKAGASFRPKIIEVGAVVVTGEGEIVNPVGCLVAQPREHLFDRRAAGAFRVTGIDREQVLAQGIAEEAAAAKLARWCGLVAAKYGITNIRAFNQPFDFGFLSQEPWDLFAKTELAKGECLMLATMDIMGPLGALPPMRGRYKWPSVSEAVAFFNGRGHPVKWGAASAHRASEDARLEAGIAIAIEAERDTLQAKGK